MPNYTYPDSGCLKNKLGAKTHLELERLEEAFVEARYAEIMEGHGPHGRFDAAHLKALHLHLFSIVWKVHLQAAAPAAGAYGCRT